MSWDRVPIDLSHLRNFSEADVSPAVRTLSYWEAIREAFAQALEQDARVFIFGEGVDDPSGMFGTTLNLHKEFGSKRVFDTPICENTLTGIAIGSALAGMRPVLVHMRPDFMLMAMDQMVNHAAKWKYMFGGKVSVPIVVRAIIGGGWGSAAQHSQPLQALFAHIPGLKVVLPATAYDAKGLLLASIKDDSPVVFIEHRWLYDYKDAVPEEPYFVPLGKAVLRRDGRDITVVSSSFMVALAHEIAIALEKEGISIEVIDLRTIKPLDTAAIIASVKKTRRLAVLDFGYSFCGISAEISAQVTEAAFSYLKSPIKRIALADVPTPASYALEEYFYPKVNNICAQIKDMLSA